MISCTHTLTHDHNSTISFNLHSLQHCHNITLADDNSHVEAEWKQHGLIILTISSFLHTHFYFPPFSPFLIFLPLSQLLSLLLHDSHLHSTPLLPLLGLRHTSDHEHRKHTTKKLFQHSLYNYNYRSALNYHDHLQVQVMLSLCPKSKPLLFTSRRLRLLCSPSCRSVQHIIIIIITFILIFSNDLLFLFIVWVDTQWLILLLFIFLIHSCYIIILFSVVPDHVSSPVCLFTCDRYISD